MSTATHGRDNTYSRGGTDGRLNVRDLGAASNKARSVGYHSVPNTSGSLVVIVARTNQFSPKLSLQCRVDLFDGLGHTLCVLSIHTRTRRFQLELRVSTLTISCAVITVARLSPTFI